MPPTVFIPIGIPPFIGPLTELFGPGPAWFIHAPGALPRIYGCLYGSDDDILGPFGGRPSRPSCSMLRLTPRDGEEGPVGIGWETSTSE